MKKLLVISFIILVASRSSGQTFTINRVEVSGDFVNLYYELTDALEGRTYTVTMFSSHDNFISALQKVKGDVGLEVRPGANKKISWNAKEELGADFAGKVGLEIRGRVYIPFIRMDGLNKTFKRLRPTELTWSGGTQQNILNFDLYKGEDKITSFPNLANVGHYTMTIPSTVKPGKDYRFKITDTRNKDQVVYTQPFAVKRKVPLLLKAIPIVLIGTAGYLAASGNSGPKNIADPPTP